MNRISTYFPVASKELHAVLEMVANVKEKVIFRFRKNNSDSSDVKGLTSKYR